MHAQMRLIAQPGVAIPNAAWDKGVVITGDDENGARVFRTLEYCESSGRIAA
jgi:hypothetical protein